VKRVWAEWWPLLGTAVLMAAMFGFLLASHSGGR
jgi:hypothetical protein